MARHNKKLRRRLLELEEENKRLATLAKILEKEKDSLIKSNDALLDKCKLLEKGIDSHLDKINFLFNQYTKSRESNMELTMMIFQLKSDLNKFSSGISKLDKILGLGQTNKFRLDYEWTYVECIQKTDNENLNKLHK